MAVNREGRAKRAAFGLGLGWAFVAAAMVSVTPAAAYGSHGGRRFHGGGLNYGNRSDHGSGFGYNGGSFGQGVYLPNGAARCLGRIDGPDGPRIVRVC